MIKRIRIKIEEIIQFALNISEYLKILVVVTSDILQDAFC